MNRDELDWLAFQYIAGELSEAEAESFEARLGADQETREAVARAVDLASAVASLPAEFHPAEDHKTMSARPAKRLETERKKKRLWKKWTGWMVVGATAAGLLFAFCFGWVAPGEFGLAFRTGSSGVEETGLPASPSKTAEQSEPAGQNEAVHLISLWADAAHHLLAVDDMPGSTEGGLSAAPLASLPLSRNLHDEPGSYSLSGEPNSADFAPPEFDLPDWLLAAVSLEALEE